MEEIEHIDAGGRLARILYIPGGCLGFPNHQRYHHSFYKAFLELQLYILHFFGSRIPMCLYFLPASKVAESFEPNNFSLQNIGPKPIKQKSFETSFKHIQINPHPVKVANAGL